MSGAGRVVRPAGATRRRLLRLPPQILLSTIIITLLVPLAPPLAATAQSATVLASGNSFDTSNPNFSSAVNSLGHTFTFVSPFFFGTTSLAGFNAIWLDGFSQFSPGTPGNPGLAADALINFMNAGGRVLVQNPGVGSEPLSSYPFGGELTQTYTCSEAGENTVRIVDPSHPIMAGLSGAGLSGWGPSACGFYGSSIGSFTGVADNGATGKWITLVRPVGAGLLVYTQQLISQRLAANPTDAQALAFLNNALSAPAPSPTMSLTVTVSGSGTVTSSPTGITCPGDCSESYASGTTVTLTPTPASGFSFAGWSGACSGTGACVVTMSASQAVTATFSSSGQQTLTVTVTGSGTVFGSGISCPTDCSESYPTGTAVTLAPAAPAGFSFAGWSGACTGTGACVVTMTASWTVIATFSPAAQPTLTVTITGTGSGVVSGPGISCPTDCSETLPTGSLITLVATPATGSTFAGWSGPCTGTGACVLTLSASRVVSATFTPAAQPILTLAVAGNGIVSGPGISCPGDCFESYPAGSIVTVTATPTLGWTFVGWGSPCAGTGPCTLTLTTSRTLTATFVTSGPVTAVFRVPVNQFIFPAVPNFIISQGDYLEITATGQVCFDTSCILRATPAGSGERTSPDLKRPGAPRHSLVCGIDGQSPLDLFFVGQSLAGRAPKAGNLFCGPNDVASPEAFADNSGVWVVTVKVVPSSELRPSAPQLLAPPPASAGQPTAPTFLWSSVTNNGANGNYRIQVAPAAASLSADPDSGACSECVVNTTTSAASYTPPPGVLQGSTAYSWQVQALGTGPPGLWSSRATFTTAAIAPAFTVVFDLTFDDLEPGSVPPGFAFPPGPSPVHVQNRSLSSPPNAIALVERGQFDLAMPQPLRGLVALEVSLDPSVGGSDVFLCELAPVNVLWGRDDVNNYLYLTDRGPVIFLSVDGVPHRWTIILNTETATFDIFFDGRLVGDQVRTAASPGTPVESFGCQSDGQFARQHFLDDLRVSVSSATPVLPAATALSVSGTVLVQTPAATAQITSNTFLTTGRAVETAPGASVPIVSADGSTFTLAENSDVVFALPTEAAVTDSVANVVRGEVRFSRAGPAPPVSGAARVTTPLVSITPRGTTLSVQHQRVGATERTVVAVEEATAEVRDRQGQLTEIVAGQSRLFEEIATRVVLRLPVSGSTIDRQQTNTMSWSGFAGAGAYLIEYALGGFGIPNSPVPEFPAQVFAVVSGGACPDDLTLVALGRFCERGDIVQFPLRPIPGVAFPGAFWRVFPLDTASRFIPGTTSSDAALVFFR